TIFVICPCSRPSKGGLVITVTPAEPAHAEALATLTEEMDSFYGATDIEPLAVRIRQVNEAIFSNPPAAYALLAWRNDRLVGFATYSFLWPAIGLTRSLYLKELYVGEQARRTGVGTLLIRSLFEIAVRRTAVGWSGRLMRATDLPKRFMSSL